MCHCWLRTLPLGLPPPTNYIIYGNKGEKMTREMQEFILRKILEEKWTAIYPACETPTSGEPVKLMYTNKDE